MIWTFSLIFKLFIIGILGREKKREEKNEMREKIQKRKKALNENGLGRARVRKFTW